MASKSVYHCVFSTSKQMEFVTVMHQTQKVVVAFHSSQEDFNLRIYQ